jgi:CDP-glycerol glycerophosphotransferase (TagB/SpsB family)
MSNDMISYQESFKKNISVLINENKLKDAKGLLSQYEDIVRDDIDIYSVKAIIAMMEGNVDKAEILLNQGMLIDSNNNDLLYNSAYLYKSIRKFNESSYFYKKLYYKTDCPELKIEIEETIKGLGNTIKNRVLIGSPIHQKPQILKEFLKSLKELNKESLDVNYCFIDDNNINESSELLYEFAAEEKEVYIYKTENNDEYTCDNNTHHWKEHLVWKVAGFKDKIIQYARDNNYDYLFFIDSDLVLHPDTLKHLISTGKDIISEIFWTRWQPNAIELPQVWLKDSYTQYHMERDETVHQDEIISRHREFLKQLRIPGIYEVGGLGACTLISQYALNKGLSFKEIKNISFWGEDRHFCIRAVALGLSLHVDTHYPAYHIYREEDLNGVNRYKNRVTLKRKNISLVYTSLSGSNTIALYKLASKYIREKYNISLVLGDLSSESIEAISNSDVAIFTDGNFPLKSKYKDKLPIVIDLWHGFPLKAMGYIDKGENYKDLIKSVWDNVDYITSYSSLFNELMNKCISTDLSKYIITGAQRNDLLFYTDGRKNIEDLFQENFNNSKFIFYMPTYRYTPRGNRIEGNKNRENIFGFNNFNINEFIEFLEKNNYIFFMKLHSAEEKSFISKIPVNKNIRIISSDILAKKGMDLYEVLNSANVLITDYSSVYFDTLLLDIPTIFTPIDLHEYIKSRGILLEPYEDWTPGPKCITQESLQDKITECLLKPNYYSKERKDILSKIYRYTDDNSCNRTWDFIDKILK